MKQFIENAKKGISKVVQSASCQIEIHRAVLSYIVAEARFNKLHPVRDASKRESVGYKLRASEAAFEVATNKLKTI